MDLHEAIDIVSPEAAARYDPSHTLLFFFLTLVTSPRRSLSLQLSDARVYEPLIRARVGNHNTPIRSKVCESAVMALALAPVPLAPRHHIRVLLVSTLVLASAGVRQSRTP